MGQTVLHKSFGKYNAGVHEISIQTQIPKGIYFMKVKTSNSEKILKVRSL
jgi:hypothetical protein